MAKSQPALFETFRKPDFDVATFVRDATGQGNERVARLTQQLEDCASSFDAELQREIIGCHEELLQNASSISNLDGQLGDIREVVDMLKSSIVRIKGDIMSPFLGVKRKTMLLERMESVNILIRKLRLFLFDARKLHTQMDTPAKDLSKAAHTLHELEAVLKEGGLDRIDLLRAEVTWIRETGLRIRQQAEGDLRSGARQGNQIALSVALQVFFNLQCMWPQLRRLLSEMVEEFSQAALPAGSGFQQALEMNLQVLAAQTQRVHLLDEVVRSKTDPLTQKTFSSVLEQEGVTSLTSRFWSEATSSLKAKLARVSQDRASRKALVSECPKVLKALAEALDKVNHAGRARGPVLRAPEREALFAAAADLRNEFLGESIRRVTEPVDMMLPDKLMAALSSGERSGSAGGAGGTSEGNIADELPTSHDLKRYVQLLVAELERCESCPELLLKEVVRGVRSSVLLFATRLEQVVDTSCLEVRCFESEARLKLRSPLPMPAAGHARNARLFGIAHHTLAALRDTVPLRFQAAIVTPQVQSTLQQTQAVIVSPMFSALRRSMGMGITSLESVMEGRTDDGSPMMLAVSQVCVHVSRYYLSLFGPGQLFVQTKELCIHFVRLFLSAAALVKPCGEAVRKALAQDMQAVENALCALDVDFQASIRHEASVFREFRRLIFAPSVEALDFEALSKVIPLHLLLSYLVHQLPENVPTLPQFCQDSTAAFLEGTLMPLWEDSQESGLSKFRAKIGELSDKYDLDPSSSTLAAFVMSQMG
mmetsp:Transcript_99937/g.254217  ORF Transcript_99937/g.254217 Transcript_99937/m.254217 type:complete len:766 (+) Transcript_99937:71-2368(+)|eukprot:CAMPEP_0183404522 /NCGR_PEP_ID=MMETSP0370-20130417/15204_1 /TAXON_ID=268820 /ORGANISM="Peridinium aciculiferum, Strain PAER-2" /LENGTH=765 /DNA_ID=CAMNT_0025586373 /DNA_START=73 /DNA_END=2370 /DNA_ORIENTATION=+